MTRLRVAIIGAGFAGIAAARELRATGEESFAIFERANATGGTWRDNVYPGVACDVPAHLYSYSFRPNPHFRSFFAEGDEINRYLADTVSEEGLQPYLQLGEELLSATWVNDSHHWAITTTSGQHSAEQLILACGRLSEPSIPEIPGLDQFPGDIIHSARWDPSLPARQSRIAVIGSGASAIQLVPELAKSTHELTVFQRSAPWIVPRENPAYSRAEQSLFERSPETLRELRSALFWQAEEMYPARAGDRDELASARAAALDHLHAQVKDERLRTALIPDYEIGCKRRLISSDYYPTLTRDNVRLVPSALARVEGSTLVAQDGTRVEADTIVFATGFQSAEQPYAALVVGADGTTLAEHWNAGMRAYASTMVSGFPNLYIVNGPNAGLGHNSAVFMIESQLRFVLAALAFQSASGRPYLAVTERAEQLYVDAVDALSNTSVWKTGGCTSWYLDARSGRLSLIWPDFAYRFRAITGRFDPTVFVEVPVSAPRTRSPHPQIRG